MSDPIPSKWPVYDHGPRQIVFALGVASVNYTRLEFALSMIFSSTTNIDIEMTLALFAKLGNDARTGLIERALPERNWPDIAEDLVLHFVKGFRICADNRNHLMHSGMLEGDWGFEKTILSKFNKAGERIIATVDERMVRQTADDMRAFSDFGFALLTAIHAQIFKSALSAAVGGPAPWPDKPPPPQPLHYS